MNLKMVGKYLGYLLAAEGVFLLPAALVAALYREWHIVLVVLGVAVLCEACFLALKLATRTAKGVLYAREGFVVAGLGWILVSLLGALPFFISGEIPNYIDAFFESASGFTTTGASILTNVEAMSKGLLFWRSLTHWLGGIGVLAFILAIVRSKSGTGFTMHLLRAETPGPQVGKTMPKTRDSVRMLLLMYGGLSAVNLIFLLAGGMPVFDALCTMFGTAGTGGFGVKNDSLASYSLYLQSVTAVFMVLFGVNFGLYQLVLRRQWRAALKDEELRLYFGIILLAVGLITVDLMLQQNGPVGQSLQQSAFTVSSVITTTGFATTDFARWPQFSQNILLLLMICGAMAGSTGGGFKVTRLLFLGKGIKAGLSKLLHPNSIRPLRINGKTLDGEVIGRNYLFLVVYCALVLLVTLLISLDGMDLETNLSATLSCVNNIGPGLAKVGPTANYSNYSNFSTVVLTFAMLLGRLEIFPILLLVFPGTWKRN